MLQEMTKSPDQLIDTKKYMTDEEAIASTKIPLGFIQRYIIKIYLIE